MSNDDLIREARKALTSLYIAVDEQVAKGVSCVIEPALTALETAEAENARLREALKPFAGEADTFASFEDHAELLIDITAGDLRKAKEALGE